MDRKQIVEEYKKFLADPVPAIMEAYGDADDRIIARVFTIVETSPVIDLDTHGVEEEYTFPIAKVYHVGSGWKGVKCAVGGYVRLRDWDALRMENPRYEAWLKNEFSKSNIRDGQIGEAPPKVIMNLWMKFADRLFSPDPFEMDGENWKSDVFFFDSANVIIPVDNPESFFNYKP